MHAAWLLRTLLASLVVVVVVCAAFQPSPVTATEEPADDAGDGTITTTLYPGWNMVGWVSPETPASELFDDLPALGRIFVWDGEEQRYRQLMPSSGSAGDQHLLAPGDGLWLYIGGTSPVEWTRKASETSVLLDLHAGRNLVAWAGRDGTPIEEAVGRFGNTLERAWYWDAASQHYRLYDPRAGLDQVDELNHGDALRVELTGNARWWQSGTAPVPVEILGDYTEREEWQIRGWVDGNRGFFAERWGVEAPVMTYAGDRESVTPVYRRVLGRTGGGPPCGFYAIRQSAIFLVDDCVNGGTHAHEYFHAIQFHLMGSPQKAVPAWITEGSATYAQVMYGGTTYRRRLYPNHPPPWSSVEQRIEERRIEDASLGYGYWPSLSETEGGPHVTGTFPSGPYYDLGFLGIAWLAEHVGDQSVVDFYRLLADKPNWREAFEPAFGMTSDEFHRRFDSYREATARPLPHRSDGSDEPVLEFLGDVPADMQTAVRAEFGRVRAFLREHFGAGAADYTIYAVADRGGGSVAHLRVFGTESHGSFCTKSWLGNAAIINVGCYRSDLPSGLIESHFEAARALTAGIRIERGPAWLVEGSERYVRYRYLDSRGHESWENLRGAELSRAVGVPGTISEMASPSAFRRSDVRGVEAVSFLAAEQLLKRAGDQALFEYYRRLIDLPRWQDAFETAFGIAVNEFHEAFEVNRAEFVPTTPSPSMADDSTAFVPSFPHMADDRIEPVLVFVGDVAAHTRQAASDELASIQAFFGEQSGTRTADYTLYIAADDEAVGEPYLLVQGRELTGGFCSSTFGIAAIIDASCYDHLGLLNTIAQYHFVAIRDRLAAVSPPLRLSGRPGLDFGPYWLDEASTWYASFIYLDSAGHADYAEIRQSELPRARQVARPLSAMATRGGFLADDYWNARAVALLAVEWLAGRAGDRAIFEYYRLLPESESWEDAFEAAFGIAIDDFYEQFEAYRARVAPPNEDADSS